MHTIGQPVDIRPLRDCFFKGPVKRNNASDAKLDASMLNGLHKRLEDFIARNGSRRPDGSWFAKNDRHLRKRIFEPPEDVGVVLAVAFNRGSGVGAAGTMEDVINSDKNGNQDFRQPRRPTFLQSFSRSYAWKP